MSKKRRKPTPVVSKRNQVMTIPAAVMYKAMKPRYKQDFQTGGHMTAKDRPRDKNWRKWEVE